MSQEFISEDINIPVKVGDTILVGKFKNKKMKIKSIGRDKHGMPTINGRKAATFRIHKQVNIFDNDITEEEILDFISNTDFSEIIKESYTGVSDADDGPAFDYEYDRTYKKRNDYEAAKLGWTVVNYIMGEEGKVDMKWAKYPKGPINSVSYYPSGIAAQGTPTNQENITGLRAHKKWVKHMMKVAQTVGYKLKDFIKYSEELKKHTGKPSIQTLKIQKKEFTGEMPPKAEKDQHKSPELASTDTPHIKNLDEQVLTKKWWESLLEASTLAGGYGADEGEPDTGFIKPGKGRILGVDTGKPEPWFKKEKWTQVGFIKADDPYGKDGTQHYQVHKRVKGAVDYEEIIPSDDFVTDETGDELTPLQDLEDHILLPKKWWKEMLTEGGAYGHMSHPFDDWDLTFKDFKNIIEMGLSGTLNREDNVTEKLDGQNLMISWKGGSLIVARNKGHIKNAGKNALSVKGVANMFRGRGEISNAFSFAAKDLQKAIGALSNKQRDKIFMNGKAWMNLEVLWPASSNVIDYDVAQIVFHGALEYNDAGTVVGQVRGSARILEGMIRQVNQHIQKHYKISKPQFLTVPKNQDFAKRKTYYFSKLSKLQNQYSLSDSDTLALWHQMFWQEWIMNGANQTDYANISNEVLVKLTKRWAFGDKSYKIPNIKKELKDKHPKFLDWVLSTDKVDVQKMQKQNMKPFEVLFFALGAEILRNVSNFLAVNPSKAAQKMKVDTKKAAAALKREKDPGKLKLLKTQMEKLQGIGGFDAVVPSEGLVFKYKGNTYKFTGAFAPVNQITGALKFGR